MAMASSPGSAPSLRDLNFRLGGGMRTGHQFNSAPSESTAGTRQLSTMKVSMTTEKTMTLPSWLLTAMDEKKRPENSKTKMRPAEVITLPVLARLRQMASMLLY